MAPAPAAARHVGCSCAELERTGLGAQPVAKLFSCIKNLSAGGRKNRTGIGAHPPAPPGARKTSSSQAKQRAMSGVLKLLQCRDTLPIANCGHRLGQVGVYPP